MIRRSNFKYIVAINILAVLFVFSLWPRMSQLNGAAKGGSPNPRKPRPQIVCDAPPPKLQRMSVERSTYLSKHVDECLDVARNIPEACVSSSVNVHLQLIFIDKPQSFFDAMARKLNIMLRSIFVSMAKREFNVRLWTNNPKRVSSMLNPDIVKRITIVPYDAVEEAAGTPFERLGASYLSINDGLNYRGGDLLRLIALYKYGGLYMDTDALMLRDPSPLLANDFVTHWECIDGKLNGAIMYAATPKSAFLTKLAESAYDVRDSKSSTAWGSDIYSPLMQQQDKYNFTVLPNCYWDIGWSLNNGCKTTKFPHGSLEAAFDSDITSSWAKTAADVYPGVFGYHWHNRWDKTPVKGSIGDLLFAEVDRQYAKIYGNS